MKDLSISKKILLLTVIPLLLVMLSLTGVSIYQIYSAGQVAEENIRRTMMDNKRTELRTYMDIARTAIDPIVKHVANEKEAKDKVKKTLRAISFSGDGYVFAYEYSGVNVVLPAKPELEGRNLIDLKDVNGVRMVEEMIKVARSGGGYVSYDWYKPTIQQNAPKLSYAIDLKELGWMLGTGFYIDDVDRAVAAKRAEIQESILMTAMLSLGIGLFILLIIVWVNLRFSRRTLVDPIEQLSQSAQQMSLGKLDTPISVDSSDEIGELADAISRMQKSLQVIMKKLRQTKQ